MLQLTIIGHLGADAEIKNSNGHNFVSFRVAHTESFTDAAGNRKERTQWISCALNGDGGELFKYLKQGTQVCVVGNMTLGVASSQKLRAMVATCNVHVRSIELLSGGNRDEVPRQLADCNGRLINTMKMYTVDVNTWQELGVGPDGADLYDNRGNCYRIDSNAIITKLAESPSNNETTPTDGSNTEQSEQG